jgi:MFS superfamily sulfate permease-like transporter
MTLPLSVEEPTLEAAVSSIFNPRHLPLFFATTGPSILLYVTIKFNGFFKVAEGVISSPIYLPTYMASVAVFFWIGVAVSGQATSEGMNTLRSEGWLFSSVKEGTKLAEALDIVNYWKLYDFTKVRWSAVWNASSSIVVLVLIGVLNLPIATSTLSKNPRMPHLNMEQEMFGSAAANLLSGLVGSVPTLIVRPQHSKTFAPR